MAKVTGDNAAITQRLQGGQAPAQQEKKPAGPGQMVAAYLEKMAPQMAQVLPKHVTIERLTRIAITLIRTNPKLLNCEIGSLMGAVMQAAQLGLEPGLLGHCYIIPYGQEATFIIGYRGMIDLARRSGEIQSISAHEVYANDLLELEYGLSENLRHVPWHLRKDEQHSAPGDIRGFYMVARFKDGGYYIHYMSRHEVDQHRERSKSKNNGPWVTDYVEMGKKTVVRAGWKWLPISVEIMCQVATTDETAPADMSAVLGDGMDATDYAEVSFVGDSDQHEPEASSEETADSTLFGQGR